MSRIRYGGDTAGHREIAVRKLKGDTLSSFRRYMWNGGSPGRETIQVADWV